MLSDREEHSFGCREWKEFSGQGDYQSYVGHFRKYTFGDWLNKAVTPNPFNQISDGMRSSYAAEVASGLGMIRGDRRTIWSLVLNRSMFSYSSRQNINGMCIRYVQATIEVALIERMYNDDPYKKIEVIFNDSINFKIVKTSVLPIRATK